MKGLAPVLLSAALLAGCPLMDSEQVVACEDFLKSHLNDPNRYERLDIIESSPYVRQPSVSIDYTAPNKLGGRVRGFITCKFAEGGEELAAVTLNGQPVDLARIRLQQSTRELKALLD